MSRWFFTGVWVTGRLLKTPGLFLVFWPFSIMLTFGWSPPVRLFPSPPVPLVIVTVIIIIIIISCSSNTISFLVSFFTPELTCRFSLHSEWSQVVSGSLDFYKYWNRLYKICRLYNQKLSHDFQLSNPLSKPLKTLQICTITNSIIVIHWSFSSL